MRIGTPKSSKAMWFLVEYIEGVNYVSVAQFGEAVFRSASSSREISFDKSKVKALLQLASSDRERELICCYSVIRINFKSCKAMLWI